MLEKSLKTQKSQVMQHFSSCSLSVKNHLAAAEFWRGACRKGPWVQPTLLAPTRGVGGPRCTSWPCCRTGAERGAISERSQTDFLCCFLAFSSPPRACAPKTSYITAQESTATL